MKVAILAGGFGTRLAELTEVVPKPMVDIGGFPILWHIMQMYAAYGFKDFVVALGYKGDVIRSYFENYAQVDSKAQVNVSGSVVTIRNAKNEFWNITLVDTGEKTMTGGRLLRLKPFLDKETFMLTYGDGVSDVDIHRLLAFHHQHNKKVTVTAVNPTSKYGKLSIENDLVLQFSEKPTFVDEWINGGFFVMHPDVIDLIASDATVLEREPLEVVAKQRQMVAFKHQGFWHCMDTLRDKQELTALWQNNQAHWKKW